MYLVLPAVVFLAALSQARKCTTIATNNSPPSTAVCGSYGKLDKSAVLKRLPHLQSSDGISCLQACLEEGKHCHSISVTYNSTTKIVGNCTLYSATLANMALNTTGDDPRGKIFNDISCWECIQCDPETEQPKITNGGFGDSKTSIAPWTFTNYYNTSGVEYALVPGHLQVGDGNAFRLTVPTNDSSSFTALAQKISICAPINTLYKITFNYKFAKPDPSHASLFYVLFPDTYATVESRNTVWHNYETSFYWDAARDSVYFNFITADVEQVFYIDNVRLVPKKTHDQTPILGRPRSMRLD